MRFNLILVCCVLSAVGCRTILNAYSQEAELNQLVSQQADFQKQIQNIKNGLTSTSAKLQQVSKKADRISALEEAILKQRNLVFQSSKTLLPPFNLSKCTCQELSANQKQNIINDLNEVRKNINALKNSLKQAPACTRTRQMAEDLNAQLFFIDTIEQVLDSRCRRQAILTPTIWQTNLNSRNWILGDQTLDDVVDQYFKRSIKYENITNCPVDFPYFNSTHCINCPHQRPLFNLYTMKCTQCDNGYKYSSEVRTCVESESATQVICTENQFYLEETNKCVDFVSCGPGTRLDKKTNTCRAKKCAEGFQVNKKTGQCEKMECGENYFNPDTFQCEEWQDCKDMYLNREKNKCEAFVECDPEKNFLNKVDNVCVQYVKCKDLFLNRKTNRCEKKIDCGAREFYVQSINNCEPIMKCSQSQYYNKLTNQCQDYKACPDTQFLNRQLNLCQNFVKCPKGTILNPKLNTCVGISDCDPHSYFSPYTYKCENYVKCSDDMFLNRKINQCEKYRVCQGKYLERDVNQCVEWKVCQKGMKLNQASNECEDVPRCPGQYYNQENNKCEDWVECKLGFLNKISNKCEEFVDCGEKFLNKDKNLCEPVVSCDHYRWYNNIKNRCEDFKQCSQYLDRITNVCQDFVNCPPHEQINKLTNTCRPKLINCQSDEVLNIDTGKCVKKPIIYKPHQDSHNYLQGKISWSTYLSGIEKAIQANPQAQVRQCPANKPYSLIDKCMGCETGRFFLDTHECEECKKGYEFDESSKSCRIVLYLTNLQTGTIDLQGISLEEYKKYEEGIVKKNPNAIVKTCPEGEPYSVEGQECISCSQDKPLFDVVRQGCSRCEDNKTYNKERHLCE